MDAEIKTLPEKEEVRFQPFWYSDYWIFPKLITIVTTLHKHGRVNAGPYSHIMQYDVMQKKPRVLIGFNNSAASFRNIRDTGEFVINCPKYDTLDDMMETARFYPEGANELDYTGYTMIPSRKVKPPSIAECPQIMEHG
ncbi:MAG: flavin reductase family protein [Gammaproteobacteria bacterium]|nr:flavin reductase family protein [Gammaproteobacteria bacterium]